MSSDDDAGWAHGSRPRLSVRLSTRGSWRNANGRSGRKAGNETERGILKKDGLRMERNSSRASGGRVVVVVEGGRDRRSGVSGLLMSAMNAKSVSCLRVKRAPRCTGRGATTIGRSFDMAELVKGC